MSETFEDVVSDINKLWACTTFDDVCHTLDAYSRRLGFDATLIACSGRLLSQTDDPPPFWTNANPKWMKYYHENNLYSIDPVIQMSARSCQPFTFTQAYLDATPEVSKFRTDAIAAGLAYGWTFPVHKRGMATGLVTFAGSTKIQLSRRDLLAASMIAMAAYEAGSTYFAKSIPELALKLTDRERAILTLVARGKTNWEAGTVLSISEYSVRDHLKTVSTKLRTSNRTHTVARAMQLGLIVP